jgi:hypothetical protein
MIYIIDKTLVVDAVSPGDLNEFMSGRDGSVTGEFDSIADYAHSLGAAGNMVNFLSHKIAEDGYAELPMWLQPPF